jgi:hypothetical protein
MPPFDKYLKRGAGWHRVFVLPPRPKKKLVNGNDDYLEIQMKISLS